jgi:hypothetical protein
MSLQIQDKSGTVVASTVTYSPQDLAYLTTIAPAAIPATENGGTWTFTYTWEFDSKTYQDVQYHYVSIPSQETRYPILRQLINDNISANPAFTDDFIADLLEGKRASFTFDSTEVRSDITFTSRVEGETPKIVVELYDPKSASVTQGISMWAIPDGVHIKVTLATNASSAITSTAASVAGSIAARTSTDRLVSVTYQGDGSGTVIRHPAQPLRGGRDGMDMHQAAYNIWLMKGADIEKYYDVDLDGQLVKRHQWPQFCLKMADRMMELRGARSVGMSS